MILSLCCLAVFAVSMLIRKARRTVYLPVIAITAALACIVNLAYSMLIVTPIQEECTGGDRLIEATLTEEEYSYGSRWFYRLRADSIDGEPTDAKLMLSTIEPLDIEPFDKISFKADIYPCENDYNIAKGYYLSVYVYDGDFEIRPGEGFHPMYYAIQLRRALRSAIEEYLPEDVADLCRSVFIGDKYALDYDTKLDFRYAGASYFVVVSGMHFAVFMMLISFIIRKLRKRFVFSLKWCFILRFAIIILYVFVTGFQPSVIRAGVMMLIYTLGDFIYRINDSYTSLGSAAIVSIIVFSPYGAGDIGLILSFAATFAIISWQEPINDKLHIRFRKPDTRTARAVNTVISVLSVSLAANILVVPISILVFRGVSLVTLFSSLILIFPIELIMVISLLLCAFFYLGPLRYISLALSWPLYIAGRFVLISVRALASLPFSYVRVEDEFFIVWVVISVILGIIVIARRDNYRFLPAAATISAIILLSGIIYTSVVSLNTVSLEIYGGSGMAVGLDLRGRLSLLSMDTSRREASDILDRLASRTGSADAAVCTGKRDLNNYLRLSEREFAISDILMYDTAISYSGGARLRQADDSLIRLDDDAHLELRPQGSRLLSYLTVGKRSILIVPDGYPYRYIPEGFRDADIIIMRRSLKGYEGLSCSDLVICGDAPAAAETAAQMSASCEHIDYACEGDITIDLR